MDHFGDRNKAGASVLSIPKRCKRQQHAGMKRWFDRARVLMKEKGVTQSDLADAFEMTPAGMQKWLSGDRDPTLEDIIRIADYLRVSRAQLLLGAEEEGQFSDLPAFAAEPLEQIAQGVRSGTLDAQWFEVLTLAAQLADRARGLEGTPTIQAGDSADGGAARPLAQKFSKDAAHLAAEFDKLPTPAQQRLAFSQIENLLRLLQEASEGFQAGQASTDQPSETPKRKRGRGR